MPQPNIRRARADEAAAIAELWLRSRRAAEIPPAVHTDDEVREWVAEVLLPQSEVWVALDGTDLAGVMALDEEWVEQLYVSPEHQRRGHGSRLLDLAKQQLGSLALWTFVSNVAAQRFYEAHGFVKSGALSDDNEEHAPAILYRWNRSA